MSSEEGTRDEARGDEIYQPAEQVEPGEAQPDMENALGEPDLDRTLDTGYSPPERPVAVARHGTTAAEQRAGETLDQRLAQEEPEPSGGEGPTGSEHVPGADLPEGDAYDDRDTTATPEGDASTAGRERAGRLAPAEGEPTGRHIAVLARDAGIDGGAASAEEAAVHVVEEPSDEPGRDA
ncbi:DUF5709 domain-containing protein [Streptomyces sp. NPDC097619]|uniref:DUF5709 domain-containing protein n=1 Tax=Streptomyces sp. NPDC097619 TaxID=3157228 RepID=UPI003328A114